MKGMRNCITFTRREFPHTHDHINEGFNGKISFKVNQRCSLCIVFLHIILDEGLSVNVMSKEKAVRNIYLSPALSILTTLVQPDAI